MSPLLYSMAGLVIGAVASDLDTYFGISLFFWMLMTVAVLSGLWLVVR